MDFSEGVVWKRKGGMEMEIHGLISSEDTTQKNKKKNKLKNKKKKNNKRSEANGYRLVSFKDLPDYMKDNEYILDYYRANWPLKEAAASVFRWHNETLNVWTHLLGFLLFLGLTMVNLMQLPQVADLLGQFTRSFPVAAATNAFNDSKDFILEATRLVELEMVEAEITPTSSVTTAARWPFFVYLAGSMFCLLCSGICHLFSCHSHSLTVQMLRMDYLGIAVMIVTSFFPPVYYIFQCAPLWQFVYLAGITMLGIFTVITLFSPSLSSGKFRSFRALLFIAMGFFAIIPATHATVVNWSEPRRTITLVYESVMALSYLTGAFFYVSRIPERWRPGWFDLAGHSHQIFHVFVIMGALAHYGAALIFVEWRNAVGCSKLSKETFTNLSFTVSV
ncbi:PREDICTED: heptahelical transmembrane protein 1-like [Nelumbo nucifera]|uniref:Heptahelical transmembrane protein 1-like n=2 Tax=Nelumbo nucifera TaxID=4432 RepID=A0A822ZIQ2_NELNU|nr:PREDICTED: heptahelical transmembrane protein 1-like [Nelumbo nucifera]DAD45012.1 TPA_asm: hypothetical protein HUJ06_003242 [Nelumbo nucifera]